MVLKIYIDLDLSQVIIHHKSLVALVSYPGVPHPDLGMRLLSALVRQEEECCRGDVNTVKSSALGLLSVCLYEQLTEPNTCGFSRMSAMNTDMSYECTNLSHE